MSTEQASVRPGSYSHDVVWCFELMAKSGQPPSYRDNAIFVVHGIGGRMGGNVAVELRYGLENALGALKPPDDASWQTVPATYIKVGYWGNYGEFKDCFPRLYGLMNQASQNFFSQMWTSRSVSATRTAAWFEAQVLRLPGQTFAHGGAQQGWLFPAMRSVVYLEVAVVTSLALFLMLWRSSWRNILAMVVGDVNFYLAPKGPIESAIVQSIDQRVRDLFLQMLGLDAEFNDLPEPTLPQEPAKAASEKLRIGDETHVFQRVTWVAHSLGTVVSYNVISDLLHKCEELEAKAARENNRLLRSRVRRVEEGLSCFITLGSPLQKMAALFPGVLRPWPQKYLKQFYDEKKWVNFYHILDPVSGVLRDPEYFAAKSTGENGADELVPQTYHSPRRWTLPGLAHVSYWHTPLISQYIIAQTHTDMPGADRITLDECPRSWFALFVRHVVMLASLTVATPTLIAIAATTVLALGNYVLKALGIGVVQAKELLHFLSGLWHHVSTL